MASTNDSVIVDFITGAPSTSSGNLRFAGGILFSYGEAIALRQSADDATVFFVDTFSKYSLTTTQHASGLIGTLSYAKNGSIPGRLAKRGGRYTREDDVQVPGRIVVHRVDRATLRKLAELPDVPPTVTRKGRHTINPATGERMTRAW